MPTFLKVSANQVINLDLVTHFHLDVDGNLRFYFNYIVDGWPACEVVRRGVDAEAVLTYLSDNAPILNVAPGVPVLKYDSSYDDDFLEVGEDSGYDGPPEPFEPGEPPQDLPEPYVADEPEPMYF